LTVIVRLDARIDGVLAAYLAAAAEAVRVTLPVALETRRSGRMSKLSVQNEPEASGVQFLTPQKTLWN
jgi:hypothetical protein